MTIPLHALIVEDNPDDAWLLARQLKRAGYDLTHERVDTAESLTDALTRQRWDIVICDYRMPGFSGIDALAIVKEIDPEVPFIIVSGVIIEDMAIVAMREGARDCIMKDKIQRLFPAIERELKEAAERRGRREAEKALIESEKRYQVVAEQSSQLIYDCDVPTGAISWAGAIVPVTGCTPAAFAKVGAEELAALLHPEDRKRVLAEISAARENVAKYKLEYRFRKQDRSYIFIEDEGLFFPNPAGSARRMVGSMKDVTERKMAEEKLSRLNEELEERVRIRTSELQDSVETLKATQKQLVEAEKMASLGGLVAGIAHEINTPLGIGITAVSFIEDRSQLIRKLYSEGRMARSDFEKFIGLMEETAANTLMNLRRAAELIQSFKQVGVDQTAETRRTFNIRDYFEKILLSLKPEFKRTKHHIRITGEEEVELDSYPGVFMQIITNLVKNSLIHAFTDTQVGLIEISIEGEPDAVVIRYRDNGRGMADEEYDKLYEPFFTTQRGRGGTGLGMHIVYNLVTQSLSGRIECTSLPGKGTVYTIRVPKIPVVSNRITAT